jgi:hypothetical protein
VAGDEERTIAGAVGFKGRPCAVGGEAVELDDEVLVGPEAVDLFAVDSCVDVRPGESVDVEEGEEAQFELVLGDVAADVTALEESLDGGGPRAARVPRDEVGEGGGASEAADLRWSPGCGAPP